MVYWCLEHTLFVTALLDWSLRAQKYLQDWFFYKIHRALFLPSYECLKILVVSTFLSYLWFDFYVMPRCTVMLKLRQLIFSMLGTWWRLIKVITLLVQCFWKCYDQMHNYWCWRCHIRLGISHRRCLSHSRGRTILQHVHFYGYQIIEQLSIHNILILQRWTTTVRKIPALFSLHRHLHLIIAGVQSCE